MAEKDEELDNTLDMSPLWTPEGQTKKTRALAGGKSLRHELRTPLNHIIGYAEMLREDALDNENEALAADLKKIEMAGRRLLDLINQLTEKREDPAGESSAVIAGAPSVSTAAVPSPSMATPSMAATPSVASGPGDPPPVPLPSVPAEPKIETAPPPAPAVLPAATDENRKQKVLVVDDIETNRDMLARRLERKGFETDTADGGRAALDAIRSKSYDLVILDVMMPDLDGFEVLQIVRQSHTVDELPVIMATARDSSEDVVKALKLGANDYVTKPLDFGVVMARVNTQMALKQARDRIRGLYRQLEEAQLRIRSLVQSSANAMNDTRAWVAAIAKQVAPVIGATRIDAWIFKDDTASSMTGDCITVPPPPSIVAEAASKGTYARRGNETIVPVVGMSGRAFGALVVVGAPTPLTGPAVQLIGAFARQLGGALELQFMREQLARSAEERMLTRKQMIERGIDLVRVCPACGRCYPHDVDLCEDDGTELPEPLSMPYRIADRYRLESELGRGGMGTVYAAKDERLDRPVAIKVVAAEHFTNETLRVRFENEAKAAARVEHEGVVAVFDSGELHNGGLYLVMELLKGCDLGQMIRAHGPGAPVEVASLVRQAGSALAAAHRALLVHRDIKPENIFLVPAPGGGFRVKLLDFGVAKQMTHDSSLTQTGALVGTPLFMSPEQILGKETTQASDVYSLASVIYLALSGRRVTLGESLPEILLDVVQQEPPALSSLVEGVPEQVDQLFQRALAKSPDDRCTDVEAWAAELAGYLERMPSRPRRWTTEDGQLRSV